MMPLATKSPSNIKEEKEMAKIYARYVKNGSMTIDQVPPYWRAATQALLDAEQE